MPAAAPRVLPALALAALLTAAPAAARAADPKPADTALGKVPADAEFYRAGRGRRCGATRPCRTW